MMKLMKYELRKTLTTKLILLGITAAAQIMFLVGLYAEKSTLLGFGMGILFTLALCGTMVIGLQSVVTLHRDMNTKQSYMLFMTPNSSYKILGAKVLENGLSILIIGAFFFALGALDVTLLFAKESNLQELWSMIEKLIHSFNESVKIDAAGIACFLFSMLTGWIAVVSAAYLADVISSALLNGKKYNGLLSFVIFIALFIFLTWLDQKLVSAQEINRYMLIAGGVSLLLSAGMYVATAQIMERKLSV